MQKYTKCLIKVGDKVRIITGKDRGYEGEIIDFDRKKGKIKVQGANMKTHYPNKKEMNSEASITKKEGFIDVSNVMILNAEGNITRLKRGENGRQAVKGKLSGEK